MSSSTASVEHTPRQGQPSPKEVVRRIGERTDQALAYVLEPDPRFSRLSRKTREALITELPPVTAAAMLGPAALARHLIASAATGRYRDLFALWELFRARPQECKPVLADRQRALERARARLHSALRLGLRGRAERVAEDVERAEGLPWDWVREVLVEQLPTVGQRPAVASALLHREPDLEVPLPSTPSERWLSEAAVARQRGELAPPVEAVLAAHAGRLPPTVANLGLAHEHFSEHVPALVDRVALEAPDIAAVLAWARDHGQLPRLEQRVSRELAERSVEDRPAALAAWHAWRERGLDVALPPTLHREDISDLAPGRPETAALLALLVADGLPIDPQAQLDELATQNRQLAEKAYEAFVCAGLAVRLPLALEGNPIVRDGTRCEDCRAWTWVRPGHEQRCPQRAAEDSAPIAETA